MDRRSELLDRAEEVGPEDAVAELVTGHMPCDVIEDLLAHRPRSGGLAALALAAVRPPPDGYLASVRKRLRQTNRGLLFCAAKKVSL